MVSVNRPRAAIIASLAAMTVGFILLALYVRQFQRDATGGRPIELLAMRRDVAAGTPLSEQSLVVRTLPEAYLEDRQVLASDIPRVLGVRSSIDLQSGQTLLWTDLSTTSRDVGSLSSRIPKGMRAIGLAEVGRRGFGALAQPGDRADVLLTRLKPGTDGKLVTVTLLQNVLILAVGNTIVDDRAELRPAGSDSVTLLVTVDQASLLAHARREGTLTLVLRNGNDLEINETLPETDDSDVLEQEKRARRQRRLRIERVD